MNKPKTFRAHPLLLQRLVYGRQLSRMRLSSFRWRGVGTFGMIAATVGTLRSALPRRERSEIQTESRGITERRYGGSLTARRQVKSPEQMKNGNALEKHKLQMKLERGPDSGVAGVRHYRNVEPSNVAHSLRL